MVVLLNTRCTAQANGLTTSVCMGLLAVSIELIDSFTPYAILVIREQFTQRLCTL